LIEINVFEQYKILNQVVRVALAIPKDYYYYVIPLDSICFIDKLINMKSGDHGREIDFTEDSETKCFCTVDFKDVDWKEVFKGWKPEP